MSYVFQRRTLSQIHDLAPGQTSRTFRVSLTTLDAIGSQRLTTVTVNVTR